MIENKLYINFYNLKSNKNTHIYRKDKKFNWKTKTKKKNNKKKKIKKNIK